MTSCVQLQRNFCAGCGEVTTFDALGCIHRASCSPNDIRVAPTAPKPVETNCIDRLAVRQRQVFNMLARGMTCDEIGKRLCISVFSVRSARSVVIQKLGISLAGYRNSSTPFVSYAAAHNIDVGAQLA